jgi:hypothetical protein
MAGAAVKPKILRDPPARLGTAPDRTRHAATPAHGAAVLCAVRGGCEPVTDARKHLRCAG